MDAYEVNDLPVVDEKSALAYQLAHVLSDAVTAGFIAQGYHWNVMGSDFRELHDFFGEIYADINSAIDSLAEYLLKNGHDAPYLLEDFMEITCVKQARVEDGNPLPMLISLLEVNQIMVGCYTELFDIADAANAQDIADFAAGRLDAHNKWVWQLKATLGIR